MLKNVIVRLRLTSPPRSKHQTLLPEPPGEHDEQMRPKPKRGRSRSRVIPTQNPIWSQIIMRLLQALHESWLLTCGIWHKLFNYCCDRFVTSLRTYYGHHDVLAWESDGWREWFLQNLFYYLQVERAAEAEVQDDQEENRTKAKYLNRNCSMIDNNVIMLCVAL